jgi:tetratricopeptide (TPR) repeat protein
VEIDPQHSGYRLQLARTLTAAGNSDAAIREYRVVLERDAASLPALQSLGMLALERREFTRAASLFRQVLALNPRDFQAAFALGQVFVQLGETDSASMYLAASLTIHPTYVPGLDLLGSIYYEHARYTDALRLYRRAILQQGWNPELWYKQGLCLERLEDYDGAIESLKNAVRLDSTHSAAFAHLGQAYYRRDFYDSSAAAYHRAAELDRENPVLHLNEGLALSRLDSVDRAEAAFRRAIRYYEPESIGRAYMHLGALYYNAERYRAARTAYAQAVQFESNNSEALFFFALANEHLKDYVAAVDGYRRYIRLAERDSLQRKRVGVARERIETLRPLQQGRN